MKTRKSKDPDSEINIIKTKIQEYVRRVFSKKEREYFESYFEDLVRNNTLPLEILEFIPAPVEQTAKTRFDQLYDAVMELAFPGYREETLKKLLGPDAEIAPKVKIWRIMFPKKFNLSHVLIRANSFQQAFALGCDYACRMSLKVHKCIPHDLTIRVQFVSEKSVRRMLDMRWANRVKRRKQLQLVGRKYSYKEILGARNAAIGDPSQPEYSIFKYAESRDIRKVLSYHDSHKISSVETETFRPEENIEED